ncbi:uncharacterized protein LOC127128314 [Lathyrus oleraceus]|uniref:DUF4378 domain-containing protein n=1 Tax=Pisum sativum TaxID=3888 RepID=A0A9D4Y6M6_PEA|nr:uncharacterized protein LOC127128314 [Pisum sativum]XP_050913521.1 uncharacterized protein LOC127128314 [Pisum sativum]XP_050913522.1 uncharacterized protein LOC127128314 [Pisum sativum]KAI5431535.1 hypothetical protein KIW84_035643 [Pisum sativum]
MESKHEASSVILKLMGLDKVASRYEPVRDRPKVLSEDYLQKVSSIGVRRKRSSRQYGSLEMSTDEKDGSDDVLMVVETSVRRDKNHNSSKGNGKENLSFSRAKVEDVPQETGIKSGEGNLLLRQKTDNRSRSVVHAKDGLNETFRFSKFQLDQKDLTFDSRFSVLKANPEKEGNGKIKSNIRCKVGFGYSFSRNVPTTKRLADNRGTMTKDDLFQKYWGLSKNVSANRSTEKSEDMNLKLKKRCYGNNLFEKEPMLSQLSSSDTSAFVDSLILQQTDLMNGDVKNNEDSNMSEKIVFSLDSSVDFLVSDVKTKVVGYSDNSPTTKQSESTASVSHASKQQETLEFQEDSVYSVSSGADADSVSNFLEGYEPSPISVLDSTFSEVDISIISEYSADGAYDSSEVDDEELDLNVSSDEDCGKECIADFEVKRDIVGLSRTEESRDFSYVVEVLTEAGISNASLFSDFSTWHSAECPISPSIFNTLEKKFGEQQLWKRSERRLLFDRINLGLLDILHPYLYIPVWEMPVSRRLNTELRPDMIEDEMWELLVSQEKKAGKESIDDMLGGEIRWIELGEDVEGFVREVVKVLIEELVDDIVRLENI